MYRLIVSLVWVLLGSLAAARALAQHDAAHAGGIDPTNIAVIINVADPLSVAVGEYYARARRIPAPQVIRVRFPAGASELAVDEFRRVKAQVDASTPAAVQAYVLTWAAPYRVGCMSITSAFAFGYDRSYCGTGCVPTRLSPYFNSSSRSPARELRMRPAMMLAGRTFPEIKALIDRGVQSDGTFPRGTAYLLFTKDKARDSRVPMYPTVKSVTAGLVNIEILHQDTLVHREDVMFYFTGLASVTGLDTLRFLPGAIADHLTSFGGMLTDSTQMSAMKWLEAGATGSYGTVVEPCNFPQKFANPAIVIGRYVAGETLIEAYWKSVAWPGQGVFVGEPLAAPFMSRR
ncbi:MAG TPA: TIGR03790 family protein [Burkholderiales bacterium]|nr:TIGR03790 family protein [Burkholderiales bacterium]